MSLGLVGWECTKKAMGRRRKDRQEALFISADQLPRSARHPLYLRFNLLLAKANFDAWIESRCRTYYENDELRGRPLIAPGIYFRMLLVGHFKGIDSQRAIVWRCADSLSLRSTLLSAGVGRIAQTTPSRTHRCSLHGGMKTERKRWLNPTTKVVDVKPVINCINMAA